MSAETFDAAWLALREDVDHRSRSAGQTAALARWLDHPGAEIVDLGSGTGSNLRYLAPRLPAPQSWTLIDHDPKLLERVTSAGDDWSVRLVAADLSDVRSDEMSALFMNADVVTASALLDLVSEDWLRDVAGLCSANECAALFALSYDGSIAWSGESHPDDSFVADAVNTHQRGDKGLGPALGPDAGPVAARCFEALRYETVITSTPWHLSADEGEVARALVDGWERAAIEVHPGEEARLHAWGDARRRALETDQVILTVGHVDVLALPPRTDRARSGR